MRIELDVVSIVLLVTNNAPQIFAPDYLEEREIFPVEFDVEESVSMPFISQIKYKNGIVFEAIEQRIKIEFGHMSKVVSDEDGVHPGPVEKDQLDTYMLALNEKADFLKAKAIGINFKFAVPSVNLSNMISGLPEGRKPVGLQFIETHEEFTTKVKLAIGARKSDGGQVLIADFNFHADTGAETTAERHNAVAQLIQQRKACFHQALETLHELHFA